MTHKDKGPPQRDAARFALDGYITLPVPAAPAAELTLAMWFRWGDVRPGGDLQPTGSTPKTAVLFAYDGDDDDAGAIPLMVQDLRRIGVWWGDTSFDCKTPVDDGRWHHLALRIERRDHDESGIDVWVDGNVVASRRLRPSHARRLRPGKALNLGGRVRDHNPFTGQIARFALWKRALSTHEMEQLIEGTHASADLLLPLDGTLPTGAMVHGVTTYPTQVGLPEPGRFVVSVDAGGRPARLRHPQLRLGQVLGPGSYSILIERLGLLDLEIDKNGGSLNGQRWESEGRLDIKVDERGHFKASSWDGRLQADGRIHPLPHPIHVRSVLAEELAPDGRTRVPVHRATVRFSPDTERVELSAEGPLDVTVNGEQMTLPHGAWVAVKPNSLGRVVIAAPATELALPAVHVRTRHLQQYEKHVVFLDVAAHRKVALLPEGALWAARDKLGTRASEEECGAMQQALSSLSRAIQYTYNEGPHGTAHDRRVDPRRMHAAHWSLDFRGGSVRHRTLEKHEVPVLGPNVIRLDADLAQGAFDGLKRFVQKAEHIVVHTVEAVTRDVVDTIDHVSHDLVRGAERFGDDLVHGDILGAGKDLLGTGVDVLYDGLKGGENLGHDLADGAGQLVAITIEAAGDVIHFVLEHTAKIGAFMRELFHRIGVALGKAIGWLVSKLVPGNVPEAQRYVQAMLRRSFELVNAEQDRVFQAVKDAIEDVRDRGDGALDALLDAVVGSHEPRRPDDDGEHSEVMERLEWVLSHLFAPRAAPPVAALGGPAVAGLPSVDDLLPHDLGDRLRAEIAPVLARLKALAADGGLTLSNLFALGVEVVRLSMHVALDALEGVLDALSSVLEAVLRAFAELAQQKLDIPVFAAMFEELSGGEDLTLLNLTAYLLALPLASLVESRGLDLQLPAAKLAQGDPGKSNPDEVLAAFEGLQAAIYFFEVLLNPFVASTYYAGLEGDEKQTKGLANIAPGESAQKWINGVSLLTSLLGATSGIVADAMEGQRPVGRAGDAALTIVSLIVEIAVMVNVRDGRRGRVADAHSPLIFAVLDGVRGMWNVGEILVAMPDDAEAHALLLDPLRGMIRVGLQYELADSTYFVVPSLAAIGDASLSFTLGYMASRRAHVARKGTAQAVAT